MENSNIKKKIYLILVILWMTIIFYFSNQPSEISTAQSGEIIELLSNISIIDSLILRMVQIDIAQFVIRKLAHMSVYCILAILWFMVMYTNSSNIKKNSIQSLLLTVIYACTDEIHQLFIPGRSGDIRDVLIDSIGASIGILIICLLIKRINKRKNKINQIQIVSS